MEKSRILCFIPTSRGAITLPGSSDSIRLKLVFPEESVSVALPLFFKLRGQLFMISLSLADLDSGDQKGDVESLSYVASISPGSSSIKISGRGGMVILFDLVTQDLTGLAKLREQLLTISVGGLS
jgi:hypothetical protein